MERERTFHNAEFQPHQRFEGEAGGDLGAS